MKGKLTLGRHLQASLARDYSSDEVEHFYKTTASKGFHDYINEHEFLYTYNAPFCEEDTIWWDAVKNYDFSNFINEAFKDQDTDDFPDVDQETLEEWEREYAEMDKRAHEVEVEKLDDVDYSDLAVNGQVQDDLVNRPNHYAQWEIEPIEFIMRNDLDFATGNAIKYLVRCSGPTPKIYDGQTEQESRITDLNKAIRYCQMKINLLNGEPQL